MWTRKLMVGAALGTLLFFPQGAVGAEVEEPEAPESAVSSPPMEMDDPGTPGREGIELNLVGTLVRAGIGRSTESLLDANYGIGDRIQLKYERPYLTEGEAGAGSQHGLGATEFGVKWRIVDSHGLALAIYPQYSWDDGFRLKDDQGNPEETEGRTAYFPVLVSKEVNRVYTVALNLGHRRNLEERGDDNNLALGAGRAVGEDGRILGEIYSERDEHLHNRQTDVRVGYVFTLFPKRLAHSKLELPAYASIGHSIGHTEAGELSTSFTFGVSLIVKPKGSSHA